MTVLSPLLGKVFWALLNLNGPVLGRIFHLFENARSCSESFDARFGTDTTAPVFERDQKTFVHFYVPTTASVIHSAPFHRRRTSSCSLTSAEFLCPSQAESRRAERAALESIRSLRDIQRPPAAIKGAS